MNSQERRSRQHYSPELKLKLVKMALSATDKGSSVAALAREYNINDNLLFKWIRLWQSEGRVSRPRRQYRKAASASLLPVEVTSETPLPAVTSADPRQTVCHARLLQGDITLHNPSPELLSLILREMMAGKSR